MTTSRPFSLFISSKMTELAAERRAVQSAVSQYRMVGWLWEDDAGARPEPIRSTYLAEVEACDIYIGLFWLGYGPYTIEEFEHARRHHKPCLVYEKYVDPDHRSSELTEFLDKLQQVESAEGLTIYRFITPEELGEQVQKDVLRLLTTIFRERYPLGLSKTMLFVPQVMSRELFKELIELVRAVDIPAKDLESMYNSSKPTGWTMPQSNDPGETLWLILQKLEQARLQSDGSAPILTFVSRLAQHSPGQLVRDGLYDWVKRAAKHLAARTVEPEHADRSPEETDAYLLVKFEPSSLEQNLFSIGAWCFGDRKGSIEDLGVGEEPYKLEDVPPLLDQLLEQCSEYITNPKSRLTIELFLPFELLDYDLHQWMIDTGFNETVSLDNYYPLVVRSWDRVYRKSKGSNKKSYQAWRRNWCILEEYKERHTDLKPQFLSRKDYACERDNLVTLLLDVVYLALTFVPPNSSNTRPLDSPIFPKIVSAGMSVALWPRGQEDRLDEQEVQKLYETLLADYKLDELPKIMWDRRRKADKHDMVHRLTLLWDDPNRLPLEVGNLLRAPERKGSEQ